MQVDTAIGSLPMSYGSYFNDRSVLVTGGASGMGRAQALAMAREGANVSIFDVNFAGGEQTVEMIANDGGRAAFYQVDLTDPEQVENALDQVRAQQGPVQHLFNTAGTVIVKAFHDTTEEDYDRLMDINVRSTFIVTRRVVKHMLEMGEGTMVLMSSVSALRGFGLEALYGMSKSAIHGLMMNICAEYRNEGIRCSSVAPAFVRTPHGMGEIERFRELGISWSEDVLKTTQLRICEPEEVASVSVFLSSPAATFVNGLSVQIDNGWMVSG